MEYERTVKQIQVSCVTG